MKSCSKIHPLLSLEAEGALSARDQKKVQAHLQGCADARKELASYKRMRRTLRALPEPKEPGNLHDKIMAGLHQKKSGKSENLFHFRPLWPVVAAAATTVFFFIQYPNWQDRMTSQSKTASVETNQPVAQPAMADKKSAQAPQSSSKPMAPQGGYAFAPVQSKDDLEMAAKRSKDESVDASFASGNLAKNVPAAAPMAEQKELALKTQPVAPAMAMALKTEKEQPAGESQFGTLKDQSLDNLSGASAAPAAQRDSESVVASSWSGNQDIRASIAQQSLLTDEASFETVWNTLEPGKPVPTVDFSSQAVVFLEAGLEPSAGYSVHLSQMEEKPNHLVLHWGNTKPAPDALTNQVVTYPWALQVIDKPSKPVSFTEDE